MGGGALAVTSVLDTGAASTGGGAGGSGTVETPVVAGSGETAGSLAGTVRSIAHFGHFTRLPPAASGTRIFVSQLVQVMSMADQIKTTRNPTATLHPREKDTL